jgi:trehalose 6-phosphate phosphatase
VNGMEFRTEEARRQYDALVAVAPQVLVGLDFDGTLSPIVEDPARAEIHADGVETLTALAPHVRAVAVVTGRPARQVVALGRLEDVAGKVPPGSRVLVRGQYGLEQWDSDSREFTSPDEPAGLAAFRAELPRLLEAGNATDAYVEEKGLAVAVHTRRMSDPGAAFARLEPELADAAERHGLTLEPGKLVLEVRSPGMHKGHALRQVVADTDAGGVLFAGDDLGDLEAFEAARALRAQGLPVLLVCSGSVEERALADVADVVVDGPDGMMALLRQLAADAARER